MPKGYMLSIYRAVPDPGKLAAYAKLAGPAIEAGGGRFVIRGTAARAMEGGLLQRTVVIEFESLDKAMAVYDTPAYQEALKALDGGADREIRFVEGV